MGSQSAGHGPIISREGLLRLAAVVERLRARANDGGESRWAMEQVCSPDAGSAGSGELAVIYVRQSTRQQVLDHSESTRLQYALTERAAVLG